MERAILVLGALLLNAVFAGPRRVVAQLGLGRITRVPVVLIRDLERKLNRDHRSLAEREVRGMVLVVAALVLSLLAGRIAAVVTRDLPFLELLVVALALPVRPTWDLASDIRNKLRRGDLPGARQALEGTPWRYHAVMDEYAVARAAIETLSVHFSEKILAPALWYVMFGLPGLFASKCVTMMQETLMQPLAGEAGFNKAARVADYGMHYLPSRLAALFWMVAMMFLPAKKMRDISKPIAEGLFTAAPQVLSVLSAALVLKLSLGGPTSIYAPAGWVGIGTARPTHIDIRRAQYLFALLHLFLFILFGLFL